MTKKILNAEERWESGMPHNAKSVEIYNFIASNDEYDQLYLKSGGDGDNGELMMFLMDMYFDSIGE